MNIKQAARITVTTMLASLLAACGGGLSGEYRDGDISMTFNGNGDVEVADGRDIVVGKYEVKDGKVYISAGPEGQKKAFRINDDGCIEAGYGWRRDVTLCRKK